MVYLLVDGPTDSVGSPHATTPQISCSSFKQDGRKMLSSLSSSWSFSHAHVALADVVPLLPGFSQREGRAVAAAHLRLHPGQPEAVDVGEVVAGSSWPLTLHKGLRSKVCQTAAWWCQRLAAALVTCTCVLQSQEMTSVPLRVPPGDCALMLLHQQRHQRRS